MGTFRRHLPWALMLVLAANQARAATDWFASLYTPEGTELRADERVFTLFALLNACGYDEGPLARRHPVPRLDLHPVRRDVRERLGTLPPALRTRAEALFDAHPQPLSEYLKAALELQAVSGNGAAVREEPATIKGLGALLRSLHADSEVAALWAQAQDEHRKALKTYLPQLDVPLSKARALLRRPDDKAVLVVDLLEAPGEAHGFVLSKETWLVVGPPTPERGAEPAVRAYAQAHLAPLIRDRAQRGWGGGATMLREARGRGAREETVGEYATALLSRAVALRATGASNQAYEAAASEGYSGLKDLGRMFDDPRLIETWAVDALGKVKP